MSANGFPGLLKRRRVHATDGGQVDKKFLAQLMAIGPPPPAICNPNVYVVDVGATKTYWGFAGKLAGLNTISIQVRTCLIKS